jgi:hypothetical protein
MIQMPMMTDATKKMMRTVTNACLLIIGMMPQDGIEERGNSNPISNPISNLIKDRLFLKEGREPRG